jgi:hypothetical protein
LPADPAPESNGVVVAWFPPCLPPPPKKTIEKYIKLCRIHHKDRKVKEKVDTFYAL